MPFAPSLSPNRFVSWVGACTVLLASACDSSSACSESSCEAGEVCREDGTCGAPTLPDPVCNEGATSYWEPGAPAFREATSEWGLDALGVAGVRLSVVDFDGDGWTDLEVRRGGLGIDDFGDPSSRRTWLLRNRGDGTFEDATESSGILARRNGEGGRPVTLFAWGDVDNDGDVDAYSGLATADWDAVGQELSEILLNDGEGHFELGSPDNPVRVPDDVDSPASASFIDVDRDGNLDLWIPRADFTLGRLTLAQDGLWRGDGGGRFENVTEAFGLTTIDFSNATHENLNNGLVHNRSWAGAACDLNGDGTPELLSASYGRMPNHLWQGVVEGDQVRFENRSVASGYAYDAERGWDDNEFARCFCASNRSAEGCADLASPRVMCRPNWNHENDRQPWRLGGNSGATICGDIDNDGDIDLLTTELRHWWAGSGSDGSELLLNDGSDEPVFERPGDAAMGMNIEHPPANWDEGHITAALFDFDNDGRLDVYIGATDYGGNRGLLYQQLADGLGFREVDPSEGIDHNRSHGIVVADFDHDGDLDVVVGHSRARCDAALPNNCYPTAQVRFFENLAGDDGNFIALSLEGSGGSNRSAIGARVRVTADGLTQTQELTGGHGHFGSQSDRVLHFGLGGSCTAEVEIRWPDAELTTERFTLPAGHRIRIVQGQEPVALR